MTFPCQGMISVLLAFVSCPSAAMHGPLASSGQVVRPADLGCAAVTITKLYRDLLTSGGRDGQPLAVATVTHLHAVLRKAFRDAVIVDEPIGSNPVERAKWPRAQAQEPDRRRARQRDDQERAEAGRLYRCRDCRRLAPAQGRPGRRTARGRRLLAWDQGQ